MSKLIVIVYGKGSQFIYLPGHVERIRAVPAAAHGNNAIIFRCLVPYAFNNLVQFFFAPGMLSP